MITYEKVRGRPPRRLPRCLMALALLVLAPRAAAQNAPAGAAVGGIEQPLRFYGVGGDFFAWNSNSLNPETYSNALSMGLSARWTVGRMLMPKSAAAGLTISARLLLNRSFRGYDPSQFGTDSDRGPLVPCADLRTSAQGGIIDPGQVPRCQTGHNVSDYRWDFGDIWLTVANPRLYVIPKLDIAINPNVLFILPSSVVSRYEQLRLGVIATVGLNRAFLDGLLVVGYSFGVRKNFHGSTRPIASASEAGSLAESFMIAQGSRQYMSPTQLTDNGYTLSSLGGNSVNYQLRHFFSVGGAWKKFSYSALYILTSSFAYAVDCMVLVQGQPYDLCASGERVAASQGAEVARVGVRDGQVFWATVGYDVLDWLNLNIAWVNATTLRKPDNSFRQPFISTNYDAFTSISVGFNVSIDTLAAALSPKK